MPTRVHFLRDAALVFARGHDSGRHAHRAVQLTLALDAPFRCLERDGTWQECAFRVFAPEQPHRIVAQGRLVHLFVDRGPRAWSAWCARHAAAAPDAATIEALRTAGAGEGALAPTAAAALAAEWERVCLPHWRRDDTPADARLAALLAMIERDPATPVNHRQLAAAAHLSTSRFAERFRAATGMPVRNYLLWRRLLRSVELLQQGHSATAAAHAAGFSDAAHLSRSFRRILGASPSQLIARPTSETV
jgi:AraC-like DNA-binding protein